MLAPMLPVLRTSSLNGVPAHLNSKYSGASGDVIENKGTALRNRRWSIILRSKSALPPARIANAPVTGYPGKVLKAKDPLCVELGLDGCFCHNRGGSLSPLCACTANTPITEYPGNVLKIKGWSEFSP